MKHAVRHCGLSSAEKSSAGIDKRGPISKQRNKHLQTVLIEAAKLATRWNSDLALLHAQRLVFLPFISAFAFCMRSRPGIYRRVMAP